MPVQVGKYRITIVAVIIAILILASIFIFPKMYLHKAMHELRDKAESVVVFVLADNWDEAKRGSQEMCDYFNTKKNGLKTFTHHKSISELEACVTGSYYLAQVEESGQLLLELEVIISTANYLHNIEIFQISNLL